MRPRRSQSVQIRNSTSHNIDNAKPEQQNHASFDKPRAMPERSLSIVYHRDDRESKFDKPRSIPDRTVSLHGKEQSVDCPKDRQPFNRSVSMYPYNPVDDDAEFAPLPPRRSTSIHVPNEKKSDDRFTPKRNKSIHAGFSKIRESDDIWIEQVVIGKGKSTRTHFKSMNGHMCRKEPPTGAKTIIYLEDVIVQEDPVDDLKETAPIISKTDKPKTKGKWKSLVRIVKPRKATS